MVHLHKVILYNTGVFKEKEINLAYARFANHVI